MKKALYIALNEVKLYLQDKGDLAFSLLLPIITFALIYFAFGGETIFEGTAYVVDKDEGRYSEILLEKLEAVDGVDVEILTESEADEQLDDSDITLFLYIPTDFSSKLESGEPADLLFKQRGNADQEGQIISSIVRGVVGEINQEFVVRTQVDRVLADTGISSEIIEIAVQDSLEQERLDPAVTVVTSSPDIDDSDEEDNSFVNEFLPGIVTMYVLFAITLTARVIVEERTKGTLERLLTTRLTVGGLFFGKFLASISRGFVQTVILLVLSYAVFQIFTPLSFVESLVISLIFAAAAAALGLIIASISHSEDGATWIAVVFSIVTFMLGGTFFTAPEGSLFYNLGKISINTYANDAFRVIIAEGGSLADVAPELGILAVVAVVGLLVSRLLFKVVPGGK
jgi:ABC-2 type transport system permease protein